MKLRLVPLIVLVWSSVSGMAQELPVTRVVLFTSGVGYFEHRGTVTGDARVPLSFTEAQVNDVLKSLILRDETGTVGFVGYPSQDPLERTLRSFALDLGGPGGLDALLPQLRGLELTLATPAEVTGRLVGLDKRLTGDRTETCLTLSTATGLRTLALSSVTQLKILDPKVERDLGQALALVAGSRDAQQKVITAEFRGQGPRTVTLGYIVEAPTWKTTYRLDLTGKRPFLQAWAIVENTSESDWSQVRLSLVAGRPVSFVQDLYTPQYVERPVYDPEPEAGPAPRKNRAGLSAQAPAPVPMASKAAADRLSFEEDEPSPFEAERLDQGVVSAAQGGATGELFSFTLTDLVTLARHRSALLPLAATDVEAKKVSLYNPAVDKVHPQNAVWLTNTTGLRLPAGPVTVYDGGMYAGDAVTDSVHEQDRRLWSYASDLAVQAEVSETNAQTTTRITVVNGIVNYRKDLRWTTTYRLANSAAEARSLVVEHPYRQERTLVAPAATERTDQVWRLPVEAAAGATATLSVEEQRTVVETQGLSSWRPEQILALVQSNGPLSPAVKVALQKLAELKGQADRAAQTVTDLDKRKSELEAEQARIRSNLSAVGRDSTQGQTYLKRLLDSESLLDQNATDVVVARKTLVAAQKALDDATRSLTAE